MKIVDTTALVLIIIGGINWGLVGFFDFNLVDAIFKDWWPYGARIIYDIVGIAALWGVVYLGSTFAKNEVEE
ncbi:MAG TPA: DUF378 domain-containing protein [Candidatus Saccharibacteria bacterium]|nr:DUF378 domain-containing protein [Candidatus Saccharibacteria bacterium]